MADRPDFVATLRRADARNRDRLDLFASQRIERRIQAELEPGRRTGGWVAPLAFAAGAALVMLVMVWNRGPLRQPAQAVTQTTDFRVHDPACESRHVGRALELGGGCVVQMDGLDAEIHTWSGARLERDDAGLRVLEGEVLLDVAPVRTGGPVRVHVSHGTIEVLGTRFRIVQGPDGGSVELLEGKIRFVEASGEVSVLAPGERLDWGQAPGGPGGAASPTPDSTTGEIPAEPVPVQTPDAVETDAAPPPPVQRPARSRTAARTRRPVVDPAEVIAQVARLRAAGHYDAAADLLTRAMRDQPHTRTKEVFSYELGTILARHLGTVGRDAACTHWTRHLERFGQGRYGRAIDRSRSRLGCPKSAPDADEPAETPPDPA